MGESGRLSYAQLFLRSRTSLLTPLPAHRALVYRWRWCDYQFRHRQFHETSAGLLSYRYQQASSPVPHKTNPKQEYAAAIVGTLCSFHCRSSLLTLAETFPRSLEIIIIPRAGSCVDMEVGPLTYHRTTPYVATEV